MKPKLALEGPIEYYGFIDDIVYGDDDNAHSRSYLLIDCVQADRFEARQSGILRDKSALTLVRVMSTPKRLSQRFGLDQINPGDWVQLLIDDSGGAPRAWELQANQNYTSAPPRSLREMRAITRSPEVRDRELVARFTKATEAPQRARPLISAQEALVPFDLSGKIEIIALDVGQASANLIKKNGSPIGFFDVGAPVWFNRNSLPKRMKPPDVCNGFIILSHWDFDHFDLARRHPPYRKLQWFAPAQPVGPNTASFQLKLGKKLTFIHGDAHHKGFVLARGKSKNNNDRNGTGYQLRYKAGKKACVLTGDASYDNIKSHMLLKVGKLLIPHHGAPSNTPPPPPSPPHIAVISYGIPNSYRHPNHETIILHKSLGWTISTTAKTKSIPRGNRQLFP